MDMKRQHTDQSGTGKAGAADLELNLVPERKIKASGFTLIEIVVVLTILAVLAAATVPTFRGLQAERKAREPVAELLRLAKAARLRAMKERRPYQVAITAQGFTASRYFDPYLSLAELTTFLTNVDAAEEAGLPPEVPVEARDKLPDPGSAGNVNQTAPGSTGQPVPQKPEWTERFTLPAGTTVGVQYWHETVMTPVEGEMVKLWVFQPNGMSEPIKLHLGHENASFDVDFSALTADIIREISAIQ